MQRYDYTPLNEANNEIRLVTLHSGNDGTPLQIDIRVCQLTQASKPPYYEALSYTWGSTETLVDIGIGALDLESRSLAVTPNLAEALPYLRLQGKPRVLWIDAICIDQQNLDERNQQVQRMGDIYKLADHVVVWLGPADTSSDLAMNTFRDVGDAIKVNWRIHEMTPTSTDNSKINWADDNTPLPFDPQTWTAVSNFLYRTWFERLWIQQEIRLAGVDTVCICGCNTITWTVLRKAVFCMSRKPFESTDTLLRARMISIYAMGNIGLTDLLMHFERTKHCKCSDPRDRIYALLSFMEQSDRNLITPDYRKPVPVVYEEMVRDYILHTTRLEILGLCAPKLEGPSWVADFSKPKESNLLAEFQTCGSSDCDAKFDDGILKIQGVHAATVHKVDALSFREDMTDVELLALITSNAPAGIKGRRYKFGGSMMNAFITTLSTNAFADRWFPPVPILADREQCIADIQNALDLGKENTPPLSDNTIKYLEQVRRYVKGRALFNTNEGHIGLGPFEAQPGDHIVVFFGCDSPLVLRPVDCHSKYKLIGQTYTHGLMDAEAFLGPLEDCWNCVSRLDVRSQGYWTCYYNKETGEFTIEHPNLPPLPAGWRRKTWENSHLRSYFVSEATGLGDGDDQDKWLNDPRFYPDALIAQGIKVCQFELI